ncbi:hypothetical protein C5167_029952 [Papaver somniferum]|uniref:phospholipase A1-Ibeta2, chloroplastic-like n=1 Tax=Papaver somniferum TaxID=3469 RepID=UPI000E6FDECA|nr:phospholipase A1-Ibeta2, chloroplastic-like [Papaver somniferum]RZC86602.1 hypothetical protein C5167_029952 [Papaver somniferum]
MQATLNFPTQASSSSLANNTYGSLNKQSSFLRRRSNLNPKFTRSPSSKSIYNPISASATTEFKPVDSLQSQITNLDKLLGNSRSSFQNQQQKQDQQQPINGNNPRNSRNNYKRFLDALNLTGMWSEKLKQAVEENNILSPKQLQRLISPSPRYSPRNSLGSRWLEYHGSNDWMGLLDPLDENLRREIVRYGEFIQAAYVAFHEDPAMPTDKAPSPRHIQVPDRSYKVTKSLFATSSVGLPGWVDNVAPDLGWMTQRSSWIGYVAVCDDQKEIQRMGRRDIVIALRGTSTCLEWAENVRDLLVNVEDESEPSEHGHEHLQAKVECGFWNLYKTRGAHTPSLSESITQEVRRLMELYKGESLSITITGHSLGAALSVLAADEIKKSVEDAPPVAVFTFGGPRVGNRGFANRIKSNGVKVLRIVNSQDVITRVPGMFVNETLDHKLREEVKANTVLNILDNNMPWAYSHVGCELRLDSKMSPYLKPNADVACCHDLEAYLHLVDGFLASDCPYRANAKRSLYKLVTEQGSNVKKLYISKANSFQSRKADMLRKLSLDRSNSSKGLTSPLALQSCLPSPSAY